MKNKDGFFRLRYADLASLGGLGSNPVCSATVIAHTIREDRKIGVCNSSNEFEAIQKAVEEATSVSFDVSRQAIVLNSSNERGEYQATILARVGEANYVGHGADKNLPKALGNAFINIANQHQAESFPA